MTYFLPLFPIDPLANLISNIEQCFILFVLYASFSIYLREFVVSLFSIIVTQQSALLRSHLNIWKFGRPCATSILNIIEFYVSLIQILLYPSYFAGLDCDRLNALYIFKLYIVVVSYHVWCQCLFWKYN